MARSQMGKSSAQSHQIDAVRPHQVSKRYRSRENPAVDALGAPAKFDLFDTLDASRRNHRLVLEHATDVVSNDNDRLFAGLFRQIAMAAVQDPTRSISQPLTATQVMA